MYKNITPDYYGYRDDDDGILAIKEAKREVRYVTCDRTIMCMCDSTQPFFLLRAHCHGFYSYYYIFS